MIFSKTVTQYATRWRILGVYVWRAHRPIRMKHRQQPFPARRRLLHFKIGGGHWYVSRELYKINRRDFNGGVFYRFKARRMSMAKGKCEICGADVYPGNLCHEYPFGHELYYDLDSVRILCDGCMRSEQRRKAQEGGES